MVLHILHFSLVCCWNSNSIFTSTQYRKCLFPLIFTWLEPHHTLLFLAAWKVLIFENPQSILWNQKTKLNVYSNPFYQSRSREERDSIYREFNWRQSLQKGPQSWRNQPRMVKDPELTIAESLYFSQNRKGKRKKHRSRSQVGLGAVGEKPCDWNYCVNQSLCQKHREADRGF